MKQMPSGQAAQWFAELQGRDGMDLSPQELKQWEQWISQPENKSAFDDLTSIWDQMDELPRPSLSKQTRATDEGYDGSVSIDEWLQARRRPQPARWTWRVRAMAAALAGLAITGAMYTAMQFGWSDPKSLTTARGEHQEVRLSDGSLVTLGADSALAVNYSDQQRIVEVIRGEAWFDVHKDAQRPFVVRAGTASIRALGTAFNVLHGQERVVVTVTQGLVEVKSEETSSPAQLDRGQQVTYRAHAREPVITRADPQIVMGWREGRLRYSEEPLRNVIEDVNRYSKQRIVLEPGVAELQFTGAVFRDEIVQWTQSLERIFPVQLVELDKATVLVRQRELPGK